MQGASWQAASVQGVKTCSVSFSPTMSRAPGASQPIPLHSSNEALSGVWNLADFMLRAHSLITPSRFGPGLRSVTTSTSFRQCSVETSK